MHRLVKLSPLDYYCLMLVYRVKTSTKCKCCFMDFKLKFIIAVWTKPTLSWPIELNLIHKNKKTQGFTSTDCYLLKSIGISHWKGSRKPIWNWTFIGNAIQHLPKSFIRNLLENCLLIWKTLSSLTQMQFLLVNFFTL